MDEAVLAAIARWPNVPHLYGWLSLDRRGKWRLQGSPITNPQVVDFIGRNYECDERGAWFFQNGPQRGYLQLDYTPWILRIGESLALVTHTGKQIQPREALLDEHGNLLIAFEHSVGLVEDRDLPTLLDAIIDTEGNVADETSFAQMMNGEQQQILWLEWNGLHTPIAAIRSEALAQRYGFLRDPQPEN